MKVYAVMDEANALTVSGVSSEKAIYLWAKSLPVNRWLDLDQPEGIEVCVEKVGNFMVRKVGGSIEVKKDNFWEFVN